MRFLVDNALSPELARALASDGHDAIHVCDRGLGSAADEAIVELAEHERRIAISADTDFGTLLASRQARAPSVILFRKGAERDPARQIALLRANLPSLEPVLTAGSVVVIEQGRVRVRNLPIDGAGS